MNKPKARIVTIGMMTVIGIATLILVTGIAAATVVTLYPSEDAQVVEAKPNDNYGNKTYLHVQGAQGNPTYKTERSYLKFDLSDIPDGANISDATYENYAWGHLSGTPFDVETREVCNQTWGEMTITWNNQPCGTDVPLSNCTNLIDSVTVSSSPSWYAWDTQNLTDLVQANLVNDSVSIVMVAADESTEDGCAAFESKEYHTNKPQLVVNYTTEYLDLVITEKSEQWTDITNKRYNVTYTVENNADITAGAFDVGLYIDGNLVTSEYINSLGPNGIYNGSFSNYQVTMGGNNDTVMICADINNTVNESFENNNCLDNYGPGFIATVTYVYNGDTIEVDSLPNPWYTKVRFILCSALELDDPRDNPECNYTQLAVDAKNQLETLVSGEQVILEPDNELFDSYNRSLFYIYKISDGTFVNAKMVRDGYAQVVYYYPNDKYRDELHQEQRAAKADKVGLWSLIKNCTTLYPVEDAHVAEGYSDERYGDKTALYLQSFDSGYMNERIYLKFDLSNVTTPVNDTTLRLYCWKAQYGSFDAILSEVVDSIWTEEDITWANQPGGSGFIDKQFMTSGATGWHEWNTENLTSWVNNNLGNGNVSLQLKADPENVSGQYAFEAREWFEGDKWPELMIDYGPQKPDLVITNKSEEWVSGCKNYSVNYTVENSGSANATSFNVSLYIDDVLVTNETIDGLDRDMIFQGNFSNYVVTLSNGYDTVRVYADPENCVDEKNESNNWLVNHWPTMTLNPIADAHVAEGYPNDNYGNKTYLYLQSYNASYENERPYLKFDTGGIPGCATNATLRLWCWKANYDNFSGELWQIHDDSWTEMGITWNNQTWDQSTDQLIDSHTMTIGAIGWHEWSNLSSWINLDYRDDSLSLMLKANPENESGQYAFESREWGESLARPQLVVEYTCVSCGDVDGDGEVNIGDGKLAAKLAINTCNWAADVDCDGDVNIGDGKNIAKNVLACC